MNIESLSTPPPALFESPAVNTQTDDNAFIRLHRARVSQSSKPFTARGYRVQRCVRCQLSHCLCSWRQSATIDSVRFLLLMHRDEVLKPSNTGRLIADCFPTHTWAVVWHRTQPPAALAELIERDDHTPVLIFPGPSNPAYLPNREREKSPGATGDTSQLLLIFIDGTWKQARKIYQQSPWLHQLPTLTLRPSTSQYRLRHAARGGQLATAEAAIDSLNQLGHRHAACHLQAYFDRFTSQYLAMRANIRPERC